MAKWEYRVEELRMPTLVNKDQGVGRLNMLGEAGWDIVAVLLNPEAGSNNYVFLMKRPKHTEGRTGIRRRTILKLSQPDGSASDGP